MGEMTNSKKNIPYQADIFLNNVFVQQTRTIVFLRHTFGTTGASPEYWKHDVAKVLIPKA